MTVLNMNNLTKCYGSTVGIRNLRGGVPARRLRRLWPRDRLCRFLDDVVFPESDLEEVFMTYYREPTDA